jgi:adhesin transport system membrane fusion protein
MSSGLLTADSSQSPAQALEWMEDRPPRSPIIRILACLIAIFIVWAAFAKVDEVTVGSARVTPSSRSQLVQSLEGGIIEEIFVREGDLVQPGQKLASLDRARFMASVGETLARARSLEAAAARLKAEIEDREPRFSAEVEAMPELVARERELLRSRRRNLQESTASLAESLRLVRREITLTEPLVELGAASDVELIRLRRQENELAAKLAAVRAQYVIDANAEYAKTMAELEVVREVMSGRRDQLDRAVLSSPVRGIVKNLELTTIGGVVSPGGTLMEIVPIEDTLLIEARISPRDIAFIRPGLPATVKITAYDPSIYGTLDAVVDRVSPDTLQDEVHRDQVYYRVYLHTQSATLRTRDGKEHAIMPGMVATVDIRTGTKTILDYLLKPVNKAKEALRER